MDIRRSTIKSHDGKTISYATGGKGRNSIVLIHGAGSNYSTWLNTATHLKAKWISLDCRGHGASGGHPDFDLNARDVLEVAEAEGWKKFSVAGMCIGGHIALAAARKFPKNITSVILCSPFDRIILKGVGALRAFCSTARAFFLLFPPRKNLKRVDFTKRPKVPFFLTPLRDLKGTHARHYAKTTILGIDTPTVLKGLAQPVLVITGKADVFIQKHRLHKRLLEHPRTTHKQLECNHHVITWRPTEVARHINEFLNETR